MSEVEKPALSEAEGPLRRRSHDEGQKEFLPWPASRRGVRPVTAASFEGGENAFMRAASEREEHESAGRHIEDELLFEDRHPELAAYLSEIEGTYARCQGRPPKDLESAWQHVFHQCSWCGEEFEQLRKLKQSFVG